MRTLAKPSKQKDKSVGEEQKKKRAVKPQSKKIIKTLFNNPFRFKIQTLSSQDGEQVVSALISFAKVEREKLGIGEKKVHNEKVIRFSSSVSHQKLPLMTKHLLYGIKYCIKAVKKYSVSIIAIFYDQNTHDRLEELMCNVLYYKTPYVVLRDSEKLRNQLGLKKVLSIGISHSDLDNFMLKFASKCLIEIPWLVDSKWVTMSAK